MLELARDVIAERPVDRNLENNEIVCEKFKQQNGEIRRGPSRKLVLQHLSEQVQSIVLRGSREEVDGESYRSSVTVQRLTSCATRKGEGPYAGQPMKSLVCTPITLQLVTIV